MQLRIPLHFVLCGWILAACSVPNDRVSYGALGCGPTDDELNRFYGTLPNQTQSAALGLSNCSSCHSNTLSNAVRSGFKFVDPPNLTSSVTSSTPADERNAKANHFCYAFFWGPRIISFAPTASHPGNTSAVGAGYDGLVAWINQLPSR